MACTANVPRAAVGLVKGFPTVGSAGQDAQGWPSFGSAPEWLRNMLAVLGQNYQGLKPFCAAYVQIRTAYGFATQADAAQNVSNPLQFWLKTTNIF